MNFKLNIVFAATCMSLIVSCAAPVRTITKQQLVDSFGSYADVYSAELKEISQRSYKRLQNEYENESGDKIQSYDVLVLSGGGANGAFGAGFLNGWGKIEEGEFARPEFDSVSGVSTGALIAPFAFVGSEESYGAILKSYRNPDDDLIIARSLLSFFTLNKSYYDSTRLKNRIRESITTELISGIREGANNNRTLLIGATNLDYGMMRVWDLAQIVEVSSDEKAKEEIVSKLIASSAIPAAFPPVNIDDYLYVDGGAAMQVVSGIENRDWLYENGATNIGFLAPDKPLRIRIWVIINSKLLMEPDVTIPTWVSIAKRSLSTLMKSSKLQTLQDIETFSQMINNRPEFDVQMYYVSIPQDYEIPETVDMFDKDKMRGLVDLGIKMGANPASWMKRALRPGAPISDQ